jgi:hypothetical protein
MPIALRKMLGTEPSTYDTQETLFTRCPLPAHIVVARMVKTYPMHAGVHWVWWPTYPVSFLSSQYRYAA